MIKKTYALALAGLLAATGSAHAQNMLANAGFETGSFSGWSTMAAPVVSTAQAHTGTHAAAAMSSDGVGQSFAATAVSDITELSFWVKRDGGAFDGVSFTYSDSSTSSYLVNLIGTGNDWAFVNLTSQLTAGHSLTSFMIFGTSPGPAYFDDFKLTTVAAVPEPQTYALMLAGLGAIGAIARRRKV